MLLGALADLISQCIQSIRMSNREYILVTGGLGFIGSHTTIELLREGFNVIIIDNCSNADTTVLCNLDELFRRFEPSDLARTERLLFYDIDIRKMSDLNDVFAVHKVVAVIHFAALKSVNESIHKPLQYYNNNVAGTSALMTVMKHYGCKKIIFSSSATVYGSAAESPITEMAHTGRQITNPYGRSKYMCEEILGDLVESDGEWSVVVLRYFNPCGAHPSGLLGERPQGVPNNLFPYILDVAAGRRPILRVFGADYNTPDGSCIRDFIHVCDLAEAHVSSLKALQRFGLHVYNVGTGKGTSVLNLLNTFMNVTGVPVNYEITDRRPGDVESVWASTGKIYTELGWWAKRGIEDICRDGWRYSTNGGSGFSA